MEKPDSIPSLWLGSRDGGGASGEGFCIFPPSCVQMKGVLLACMKVVLHCHRNWGTRAGVAGISWERTRVFTTLQYLSQWRMSQHKSYSCRIETFCVPGQFQPLSSPHSPHPRISDWGFWEKDRSLPGPATCPLASWSACLQRRCFQRCTATVVGHDVCGFPLPFGVGDKLT